MGEWRDTLSECEKHLATGMQLAAPISIPKTTKRIIFCGVGSSGFLGNIVKDLTKDVGLNVIVVKDYEFPSQFVTTNTIIIINSYSGNSKETLQCYRSAIKEKAKVIVFTSGGTLLASAQRQKIPHIQVPNTYNARQILYTKIGILMGVFDKSGHAPGAQTALAEFKRLSQDFPFARRSNAIAKVIGDTFPIIYASQDLENAAYRWKMQCNENAKTLAHTAIFPELNHNEIMGYDTLQKNVSLIILRRERDNKNTKKSIDVYLQLVRSQVDQLRIVEIPGRNPITSVLIGCLLGDWTSYQLAELKKTNPEPIGLIDQLKSLV